MSHPTMVHRGPGSLEPIADNWGWLLALGILFIILGVIGLSYTFAFTLASALLFAVLLMVGGITQLLQAFQDKGWKGVLWHILIAALYIIAGFTLWSNPVLGSVVLTAVLGVTFIVTGIVRLVLAFDNRTTDAGLWLGVSGLLSIFLGIIILAKWPVSGLWAIGLFVAIDLLMHGWSYVFLSMEARRTAKALHAT